MKWGFALVGILLLLSGGVAEARLPHVDDVVQIFADNGANSLVYWGKVTDVSDGLISLNCWYRYAQWPSKKTAQFETSEENVTIGVASVRAIYWANSTSSLVQ